MDLHHIAEEKLHPPQEWQQCYQLSAPLLLNVVADQPAIDRVDRTRSANEDEIPGPPTLGISSSRRCTMLSLNHVFGHPRSGTRRLRACIMPLRSTRITGLVAATWAGPMNKRGNFRRRLLSFSARSNWRKTMPRRGQLSATLMLFRGTGPVRRRSSIN